MRGRCGLGRQRLGDIGDIDIETGERRGGDTCDALGPCPAHGGDVADGDLAADVAKAGAVVSDEDDWALSGFWLDGEAHAAAEPIDLRLKWNGCQCGGCSGSRLRRHFKLSLGELGELWTSLALGHGGLSKLGANAKRGAQLSIEMLPSP